MVDAFLAAAREGDFERLCTVLDPEIVLRADAGPGRAGLTKAVQGAPRVASEALTFTRLAPFARPALVNGAAGFVNAPGGKPFAVASFTVRDDRIVEIDILADPDRIALLDLRFLDE